MSAALRQSWGGDLTHSGECPDGHDRAVGVPRFVAAGKDSAQCHVATLQDYGPVWNCQNGLEMFQIIGRSLKLNATYAASAV